MSTSMKRYAKAIVAGIGTAAMTVSGLVAADSTAGKVATVVLFVLTTFGVWRVPNAKPPVPPSAAHLVTGPK